MQFIIIPVFVYLFTSALREGGGESVPSFSLSCLVRREAGGGAASVATLSELSGEAGGGGCERRHPPV